MSIPLGLLGLSVCALIAEGAAIRSMAGRPARSRSDPPIGARPADGVIEVVPVEGVDVEINPQVPRFRRFLGRLDDRGDSTRATLSRTNPPLLGRVVWFSVFVGRDGVGWTDIEIARAHDALERTGLWIERQGDPIMSAARQFGDLADVYFRVRDDENRPDVEVAFGGEGGRCRAVGGSRASMKAIVAASRAASALLGFDDVVDLAGPE